MFTKSLAGKAFVCLAIALAVCGCGRGPTEKVATPKSSSDDHGHKPAAHGGIIVEVGRDNYHAEAVFEKGGILRLYMLGHDEARIQEVDAKPLEAFAITESDVEASKFTMRPEPQAGDKSGQTSRFVGELPKEMIGKRVSVTIPNVVVGGERFRIAFRTKPESDANHGMPAKVADDDEKKLYLTPGGKYTPADIEANGRQVASQKFRGIKAQHDVKPKSGDKLCPISMTKANPSFSWVIGGKTYEFCCPPCVDEFLQMAKEKPDAIKDPTEYMQK